MAAPRNDDDLDVFPKSPYHRAMIHVATFTIARRRIIAAGAGVCV